jgi:hypothetical protein
MTKNHFWKFEKEVLRERHVAQEFCKLLHMSVFWRTLNGNPTYDGIVIPMFVQW